MEPEDSLGPNTCWNRLEVHDDILHLVQIESCFGGHDKKGRECKSQASGFIIWEQKVKQCVPVLVIKLVASERAELNLRVVVVLITTVSLSF